MQNTEADPVENNPVIHVAVAVIKGDDGRILLARRPEDKHMGGLWEFPGGKVEPDEDIRKALQRELEEELAIGFTSMKPLITIRYEYPGKTVLLDTWEVSGIEGEPVGNEGQPIRWVSPEQLSELEFPPANRPIIAAARLPDQYMVTGKFNHADELFKKVNRAAADGVRLIQFRAHWLEPQEYLKLAEKLSIQLESRGVTLILKGDLKLLESPWCHGLHLTSRQLNALDQPVLRRPDQWLVASCHDEAELQQALACDMDLVTLSPVLPTQTHPDTTSLGWEQAERLTRSTPLPVYWLGGMTTELTERAKIHGARGIAAIGAFWN